MMIVVLYILFVVGCASLIFLSISNLRISKTKSTTPYKINIKNVTGSSFLIKRSDDFKFLSPNVFEDENFPQLREKDAYRIIPINSSITIELLKDTNLSIEDDCGNLYKLFIVHQPERYKNHQPTIYITYSGLFFEENVRFINLVNESSQSVTFIEKGVYKDREYCVLPFSKFPLPVLVTRRSIWEVVDLSKTILYTFINTDINIYELLYKE